MKYFALLFLIFATACASTEKHDTIKVSGEGKVRAMPDLVNLTIEVTFTEPRMADAVATTQQTVDSVVLILEQFGKKNTDIKTGTISANKYYDYNGIQPRFTGFYARQTIDFVLHDISKFTELTGKLLATRIASLSDIKFGHSKADSLYREADLLAYDDALQSATKLAKRANVTVGKVHLISNAEREPFIDYGEFNSGGGQIETYNKAYAGRGFAVAPDVLEFRRTIISEYEISN